MFLRPVGAFALSGLFCATAVWCSYCHGVITYNPALTGVAVDCISMLVYQPIQEAFLFEIISSGKEQTAEFGGQRVRDERRKHHHAFDYV